MKHSISLSRIDDRTHIPIVWLIAALAFFVTSGSGLVYSYAVLRSQVDEHTRQISDGKDDRKTIMRTLGRLERGSARMQEHMGIKPEAEENE